MHNSSASIGTLAAALAKAQCELTNPEKSMTASVASAFPGERARTFRYAPLASGLDIVRKLLGKYEIATVQATAIEANGYVQLTTTLAHSSGEWVSSDWPVCSVSEAPPAMGAALTYARRYALFALVGIAGEDDLDAPSPQQLHPLTDPAASRTSGVPSKRRSSTSERSLARPPLKADDSQALRYRIINEFATAKDADQLARFAYVNMASKNRMCSADASEVERVFKERMEELTPTIVPAVERTEKELVQSPHQCSSDQQVAADIERVPPVILPLHRPPRHRSKKHLRFVASQPCLVCQSSPCDAHHLTFAQTKALGRKVSDEYTVPLCRRHHQELHARGDERTYWSDMGISPLKPARALWTTSTTSSEPASNQKESASSQRTPIESSAF